MVDESKRKSFVIMPFSKTEKHTEAQWTDHFKFLKDLIDSHKLIAYRSDALRGDLLRQIITDLITVPVVVADVTDFNANVFWELGVRQSFKHGTITIRERDGTKLPFDLASKGTLEYCPNDDNKKAEFKKRFHEAVEDCLSNPSAPDSHVLETISGRGTLFEILRKEETLRRLEGVLSELAANMNLSINVKKVCDDNSTIRKEMR